MEIKYIFYGCKECYYRHGFNKTTPNCHECEAPHKSTRRRIGNFVVHLIWKPISRKWWNPFTWIGGRWVDTESEHEN